MAVLVYVHGIGHQEPAAELHARLDRIVFGGPSPETRLAYYADVLHPEHPAVLLGRFRRARRGDSTLPELEAAMQPDLPAIQADERWSRMLAFRRRLQRHEDATTSDRPRWLEREAFRVLLGTLLPDVGAYFFGGHGEAMREPLRRILREGLARPTKRLSIVSHSLGTVISYNVLHEPEFAALTVDHWLTLGSPLGIDEIRWLATGGSAHPAPVPATVRRWTNVADPLDPVALDATLRDEYGPAERIEELSVSIRCRMHHAMRAYVSEEPVRTMIEAMAAEAPGAG